MERGRSSLRQRSDAHGGDRASPHNVSLTGAGINAGPQLLALAFTSAFAARAHRRFSIVTQRYIP
jgi:hypothetical protein